MSSKMEQRQQRANPFMVQQKIRKINIIARWSMIDVFGLSLVLIILEGHDLIRTDVKSGTFVLVLAIVLTVVLPFLALQIDPVKHLSDDEDDA